MQKINLRSIELFGFRSFFKPTSFTFNDDGLYILSGKNGSGKTSLIEAIYWAITGDNLKNSNQSELISHGQTEASVKLNLEINNTPVNIHRSVGRVSILNLIIGEEKYDGLHIKDQQARLYELLGVDSKIIKNTIIFGQRMTRLIESSNEEKRKLFEELFEIDFIDDAKQVTKEMINDLSNDIEENTNLIMNYRSQIERNNYIIEKVELQINLFDLEIKNSLENLSNEIDRWEKRKSENHKPKKPRKIQDPGLYQGPYYEYENTVNAVRDELRNELSILSNLEFDLENHSEATHCPACGQKYKNHAEVKHHLIIKIKNQTSHIKTVKIKVKEAEEILQNEKTKFERFQKRLDRYGVYKNDLERYNILLEQYNETKNLYESEITILKVKISKVIERKPPVDNRSKIKKENKSFLKEIDELEDKNKTILFEIQKLEWWYREAFGSNGIKAYIFAYMIDQLNESIQKYASRLGIAIQFDISMSGKLKRFNTITRINNIIRPYTSLSGGEKTRVDIAIAFGMFDLLKGNKLESNVLFLDEAFENLDDEGVDEAFDLIRLMAENSSVYIITHQQIDALYSHKYHFEKIKGNTHIY